MKKTATIIDGRALAEKIKTDLREHGGKNCGLAVILVGQDPASQIYVRNKIKACEFVGISSYVHRFDETTTQAQILKLIKKLNTDKKVSGILVQLPLPKHLDESKIINAISVDKDVDGFVPGSKFVPCTALGCLELIKSTGVKLAGSHAVIVGRSNIVGKPVAQLLLNHDCTVTIAHSKTVNLPAITKQANILVVAVGRAKLITGDMVKPGAVVIDVGINRVPDNAQPNTGSSPNLAASTLVGDVDFDSVKHVAGFITPVPGGVGPLTVAMLMMNTLSQKLPRL